MSQYATAVLDLWNNGVQTAWRFKERYPDLTVPSSTFGVLSGAVYLTTTGRIRAAMIEAEIKIRSN